MFGVLFSPDPALSLFYFFLFFCAKQYTSLHGRTNVGKHSISYMIRCNWTKWSSSCLLFKFFFIIPVLYVLCTDNLAL